MPGALPDRQFPAANPTACQLLSHPAPPHRLPVRSYSMGSHVMRFGTLGISEEVAAEFMGYGNTGG